MHAALLQAEGSIEAALTEPGHPASPTNPAWTVWLAWGVVPVAAAMLGLLAATGVLSLSKLEQSPKRDVGLTWFDALAGVWLWLLGILLAGALVGVGAGTSDEADAGDGGVAGLSPLWLMATQLVTFAPAIGYWLWKSGQTKGFVGSLGLVPRRAVREVRWTLLGLPALVLLFMATQQVSAVVSTLAGSPPPEIQHTLLETYAELRDRGETLTMLGLLVSTVVFAPVLEELFHRGFLQTALVNALGRGRRWLAIGAVSAFFAVIHLGAVPWVAVPALFVLSLSFGFLYERTGSLWPPILVHAAFNAINVAYVLALA